MGHWVLIVVLILMVFVLPYLLFLLGKDAEKTEQKIHEIKTSELPDHLDFFYSPISIGFKFFAGILLFLPVLILLSLWRHHSSQDYFGAGILLLVIIVPAIILGIFFLRQGLDQWHYVRHPAVTLTKDGLLFHNQYYSWDVVRGVSVIGYKTHLLVFELNQNNRDQQKNKITIRLDDIHQPRLSVYADEYFMRCPTERSTVS